MGGWNKFIDRLACIFAPTCLIPLFGGPLAIFTVGDCPHQPGIPYFLAATGLIPWLLFAIVIIVFRRCKDATDDEESPACKITSYLFLALMILNHIYGFYLVWSIRDTVSYDEKSPEFCKQGLYYFAVGIAFYPILLVAVAATLVCPEEKPYEYFGDCVECIWT